MLGFFLCFRVKRFVGYDGEGEELDSEKLRHCIFGGHVADYMRYLSENDEEKYKSHFSRFIKEGVTADNVRSITRCCSALSSLSLSPRWSSYIRIHI